jgi:sulfate adenylyltransferase subunit 2
VPVGVMLPRGKLLELALMSSDNHAASSLARHYPGGMVHFLEAVRLKTAALELTQTFVFEPTGLSPLNRSSASDVADVLRAAAGYPAIVAASTPVPEPASAELLGGGFADLAQLARFHREIEAWVAFRDARAAELGERLIVRSVEDSIERGTVRLKSAGDSRNAAQSVTLLEAIEEFRFDALIGGARRDEEKARAKERIVSFRDEFGQWDPKAQRPELWSLYNTRVHPGEHMRVFPISNWTELDVWQYIARENLALPSIYFAHQREVVERNTLLVPVTPLTQPKAGEEVTLRTVRFRTVGDITCTCPVASFAATPDEIIAETAVTAITERGATRMDDQTSEASMERRKKEGYF